MHEMDLRRFAALCDAYGGTIARWPEPERRPAAALARTAEGEMLLARADRLDTTLSAWTTTVPQTLCDAILNDVPIQHRRTPIALWWSGLAGLTLAGAAAGALAVAVLPTPSVPGDDGGYADTALGGWEMAP